MADSRHSVTQVLVHWLLLLEVLILAVTGLYLHRPRLGGPHGLAVFIHLSFAYAMLATIAFRVYWTFFGEPTAWVDRVRALVGDLSEAVKHYAAYFFIWATVAAQMATGIALRFPAGGFPTRLEHVLGGVVGVRTAHYVLAWTLLSLLVVHTYQAALERRGRFTEVFIPEPAAQERNGPSEAESA